MLANSSSEEKQEKKWLQILACLGEPTRRIGVASKERGSGAKCGQEGLYSTMAICRHGCGCRIHTPFGKVLGQYLT